MGPPMPPLKALSFAAAAYWRKEAQDIIDAAVSEVAKGAGHMDCKQGQCKVCNAMMRASEASRAAIAWEQIS